MSNLSEEEKKAIEKLKEYKQENYSYYESENNEFKQTIDIVLNLIQRQQKEIEELKKENKTLKQCNKNLVAEIEYLEEK